MLSIIDMNPCKVCQGAHRQAIEDALMVGASVRSLEARYGVSKSAISRHRANCLQPKVAAASRLLSATEARQDVARARAIMSGSAPAPTDVLSLAGLLERVARSLERLEAAADAAAGESQHTPLAALSSQLHRGIETAAKLQGIGAEDSSNTPRLQIIFGRPAVPDQPQTPAPRDVTPAATPRSMTLEFGGSRSLQESERTHQGASQLPPQ